MPTGKPNFNLNSYGIKYLSKEEVQEFLEKRTQGEGIGAGEASRKMPETKFDNEATEQTEYISGRHSPSITSTSRRQGSKQVINPRGQPVPKKVQGKGRNRTGTAGLKQGENTPSLAGRNQIENTLTNTPHEKKPEIAVDTKDTQFHYNESRPVSGEGMVREGASARGNRETPTHLGVTGEKTIPSGKPPKAATTGNNKGKKIAGQKEHVSTGKMVEDEDGVERNTARAVFEETQGVGQEKKENIGEKGQPKKGLNEMITGKADNNTTRTYNKRIKEITAGRKTKKGKEAYEALVASREKHGDDNHHEHHNTIFGHYHGQDEKKLEDKKESNIKDEKNRRAETNETMRRADAKAGVHTQGDSTRGDTDDDDTTESDKVEIYSTGRKKDKEKPKHQRKLHGSHRGLKEGKQKEEDMITSGSYTPTKEDRDEDKKTLRNMRMYGKSNDIITDMNIMKLDLMGNKKDENKKDDVFSPRSADVGKREGKKQGKNQVRTQIEATAPQILNTLSHNVLNNMKYRTAENKKENNIKNAAAETIFKAISLKLDLTKTLK